MQSIYDGSFNLAKTVAKRVSLLLSADLLFLALLFLWWNNYNSLVSASHSISGSLTYALQSNDNVSSQIALLSLSRVADNHCLNFTQQKSLCSGPDLNEPNSINLSFVGLWPHVVYSMPVYNSQLITSKRLPLEFLLFIFLVQLIIYLYLRRVFRRFVLGLSNELTSPMKLLAHSIGHSTQFDDLRKNRQLKENLKFKEIKDTLESFILLLERLKEEENSRIQAEKAAVFSQTARQVAHDIRSPLSALNSVVSASHQLSEQEKHLILEARKRIDNIANDLLEQSKSTQGASFIVDINQVCESLLAEKRNQYELPTNFQLKLNSSLSHSVQIAIDATLFARVLSNLINNAIEACDPQSGSVNIKIQEFENKITLDIIDNGSGVDPEVLKQLGQKPISTKQHRGSGIGFFHASKTLKEFGGSLSIQNNEQGGSQVHIVLKKQK